MVNQTKDNGYTTLTARAGIAFITAIIAEKGFFGRDPRRSPVNVENGIHQATDKNQAPKNTIIDPTSTILPTCG